MGYLALYRRFRPKTFNEVIGQDAIVKTLTNQIKSGNIGHAYLFCGARGTGKTTLAKIFAKAVNCENNQNGSPCLECASCLTLNNPSDLNIIEMDAASNNKVENVRAIKDNVQFASVGVKYKVFIIDEVHMLTTEAFNALLKTLEEPPKHAIFILATTEPQKIPSTILSRCMRFDFKLVPTEVIASLIKKIYTEMGKKFTDESVTLIAKHGEGSVRDALSIADLCLSYGEDKLTYEDVLTILGATDITKIDNLVKAIFNSNTGEILSYTDELSKLGKSIGVLNRDILNYVRDLVVIKTCNNSKEILGLPVDKYNQLYQTSQLVENHTLLRVLDILSQVENNIRYSNQPKLVFETALIKASQKESDYSLDGLISRIETLEKTIKDLKENGGLVTAQQNSKQDFQQTAQQQTLKDEQKEIKVSNKVNNLEEENLVVPPEDYLEPVFYGVEEPKMVEEPRVVEKPRTIEQPRKVEEQAVEKVVKEESVEIKVESQNLQQNFDSKRIWGTILRRLRQNRERTMLWVACQEMTTNIVGNNFIIIPNDENEEKVLTRDDSLEYIQTLLKDFGELKVKIASKNEKIVIDDLEKVVDFFGKENTIIK